MFFKVNAQEEEAEAVDYGGGEVLTDTIEVVDLGLDCGKGGLAGYEGRKGFDVSGGLVPGCFPAEDCPASE